MKTYKKLWNRITSFENLTKAFYRAKKGRPGNPEILRCFFNLEKKLFHIQEELVSKKYKTGKYRVFRVYEPKKRIIKAVPFRDRIVHHALCAVIEPIFEPRFIYDSYACRKKKGSHKGLARVKNTVQNIYRGKGYALKCDVRKYFPSVDHDKLKKIIQKRIKDRNTIDILNGIIESDSSQFGNNKGIPIGNLTSQLFANIYLNELDQFAKHELKIRHYFRYVDDFLIFSASKRKLHIIKHTIKQFLTTLSLEIPKTKTNIIKISNGVDFVGYQTYPNRIRIRKSNLNKFVKRTKRMKKLLEKNAIPKARLEASIQSWIGHTSHADAYRICKSAIQKAAPEFIHLLNKRQKHLKTKKPN